MLIISLMINKRMYKPEIRVCSTKILIYSFSHSVIQSLSHSCIHAPPPPPPVVRGGELQHMGHKWAYTVHTVQYCI